MSEHEARAVTESMEHVLVRAVDRASAAGEWDIVRELAARIADLTRGNGGAR